MSNAARWWSAGVALVLVVGAAAFAGRWWPLVAGAALLGALVGAAVARRWPDVVSSPVPERHAVWFAVGLAVFFGIGSLLPDPVQLTTFGFGPALAAGAALAAPRRR